MTSLKEFDKENIPDAVIKKLKKYIDNPDFNAETVRSRRRGPICPRVRALKLAPACSVREVPNFSGISPVKSTRNEMFSMRDRERQSSLQLPNVPRLHRIHH
jgi:hypothetical protein